MTAKEFTDAIRPLLNERFDAACVISESPRSLLVCPEQGWVFKVTVNLIRSPDDMISGAPSVDRRGESPNDPDERREARDERDAVVEAARFTPGVDCWCVFVITAPEVEHEHDPQCVKIAAVVGVEPVDPRRAETAGVESDNIDGDDEGLPE